MNVPNIPSDNIYKFIALSALAIIIIANIFFFTESRKIYEDLKNLDIDILKQTKDMEVMGVEIDNWLMIKEKELKKFVDTEKSKLIDTSLSQTDRIIYLLELVDSLENIQKDKVEPYLDNFRSETINYYKIANEIGVKNHIIDINNEKIVDYYSDLKKLRIFYLILSPILVIFLIYGFRNWYVRVQKYQDILLRNQAARIVSENK
jgi:nitrogen fixation-related uncharacterized protein